MKVEYLPSFLKDLKALKSTPVLQQLKEFAFAEIPNVNNLQTIVNITSGCTPYDINGGHGSAVSLPRLIVGTRHCRVLIVGNINANATEFDIT